jgi:hypothetical protein
MPEDVTAIEAKYRSFIEKIVTQDEVWGLEGEQGFAISNSSEDEERDVIPFWSDEAYASALAKEDWAAYKPTAMPLSEFLEVWLVGMHNDVVLAGTDWDSNLFGKEIEPLVLALDITQHLLETGTEIELIEYDDIHDFQAQIKEAAGLGDGEE